MYPNQNIFKNQSYHSKKEVFCFLLLFLLFLTLAKLEVAVPSTLYLREEVADSARINDTAGPDHRGGGIHHQHSDKLPGGGVGAEPPAEWQQTNPPAFKRANDWSRHFLKQEIQMAITYVKKQ